MDLQQERVGLVLVSEREPIAILASPDDKTRRGVLRQVVDPVSNGCIRFRFVSVWRTRLDDGSRDQAEVVGCQ